MIDSKLPDTGTSIFSVMSRMARTHDAINLSQGFPNFPVDPDLIAMVDKAMREGHNQYAPMAGVPVLREILADKVKLLYNRAIDPDHEITITSGATQAIFTAITALVRPGDEVVIIEPAYDCYRPAIVLNGGICRSYKMTKPDFKIYWSEVADMINDRTRLIIINTPHNPTGQLLKWEDMDAISQIMQNHQRLYLLSDEVYEHIIFDGYSHESVLGFDGLWERCVAVFSFGKTFHATGWKLGYAVSPKHIMEEFRKVHQYNVFSANTPLQYALASYLEQKEKWKELPQFYEQKRNLMIDILTKTPFEVIPSNGTYYILADFSVFSGKSDIDFAEWMTKEIGVAVIPPSAFYSDGLDEKLIRICFAKSEETLEAAAERLGQLH
jgi:methionine aminotransferase